MKGSIVLRRLFLAIMGLIFLSAITQAQDLGPRAPQLAPTRLSSTGDSITEAFDAELPLANHWASWANGYQDFWTWLFGLTDVNSHNQRIDRNFGQEDRTNFIEAVSGSDSFDFPGQAMQAVDHPAVRVNFDTANIYYYNEGVDGMAEMATVMPYIGGIHLKDTDGGYKTWCFPTFGEGIVDFRAVFDLANANGFYGPFTMEIEGVQGENCDREATCKRVADSVAHLRRLGLEVTER